MQLSTKKVNGVETMSSLDLLVMINEQRRDSGEPVINNTHFVARVLDELDLGDSNIITIPHPQNNKPQSFVNLTIEQCLLVSMRESKSVRRYVLAKLKELESQQSTRAAEEQTRLRDRQTARLECHDLTKAIEDRYTRRGTKPATYNTRLCWERLRRSSKNRTALILMLCCAITCLPSKSKLYLIYKQRHAFYVILILTTISAKKNSISYLIRSTVRQCLQR